MDTIRFFSNLEALLLQINLGNTKMWVIGVYKSSITDNKFCLNEFYNAQGSYRSSYDISICWVTSVLSFSASTFW